MTNYVIPLTDEQKELLITIISCHIDMVIQPQIEQAMKNMNENETVRLIHAKEEDKVIINAILDAKKCN